MKQYKVNINGKSYEIVVEETTLGKVVPMPAAVQAPKASVVAAPTSKSTEVGNGERVLSPMPGTVLKIKADSGTAVRKGQPIVILEAMKMENEITATVDGTVTVHVVEGAKINSGDIIATIA